MSGISIETLQSIKNGNNDKKELVFDPKTKQLIERTVNPFNKYFNERVLIAEPDDFKMFNS